VKHTVDALYHNRQLPKEQLQDFTDALHKLGITIDGTDNEKAY
jgi:exoribonuclease R